MNELEQFRKERQKRISAQFSNEQLRRAASEFMRESTTPQYSYNFCWLGRPIIQYPQDMIAMQEIIWNVKPDLIIETGIAHGGSLVYYASILEMIGSGEVLGIDIDIRPHNFGEIVSSPMAHRIHMIEGSALEERVLAKVASVALKRSRVMVCLDSNHTHEHVSRELLSYADFVSVGSYLVVFDTIIEYLPEGMYPDRPWDVGNNPATAVREFLSADDRFQVDKEYDGKLLISVAPGGYLRRIK